MIDRQKMFNDRLADLDRQQPDYAARFRLLRTKLLQHGGAMVVVMPKVDVTVPLIVHRGALMDPKNVTLREVETLRPRFAVFLEFDNGRIVRRHNYDCFDAS